MNPKRLVLPRTIVLVVGAVSAGATGGCVRDLILVGDVPRDAMGAVTTDAGPDRSAIDGPAPPRDGGAGDSTDGSVVPPNGAMVVSLGDQMMPGWLVRIAPEEIARRLSQFMLRKPPSAVLTAAVVASAPRTNQDVGQLTDGLLLQEASLAGRQEFYRWWLNLDALRTMNRDPALFPLLTSEVRQALIDQTLAFAEDVTWRPGGDLTTLLTEPAAFVTAATAPWFPGVRLPGGIAATKVMLTGYYAGIVTQPAVVATSDHPTRAQPSQRGQDVLTRYLCRGVPPEPPGTPITPVPVGQTLRQWLESTVGAQPACGACHSLIDPIGLAFGHFDAVGAFHETEGGLVVDTLNLSARLATSQVAFGDAAGLAAELGFMPEVRLCFAATWLAFASGKSRPRFSSDTGNGDPLATDADYVVKRATVLERLNLRGTIRAVTETHTFLDP